MASTVKLYAPPEYWALSPDQHRDLTNGCGPALLNVLIPDHAFGLSIRPACDIHDVMYALAAPTIEAKDHADRVFRNNLIRLVDANTAWAWLRRLRLRQAEIYYQAVHRFGGPWFWRGKNNPEYEAEVVLT